MENWFSAWTQFLTGRKYIKTKMSVNFLMGNKVLNIFSLNNFFKKSGIFRENSGKLVLGKVAIFEGKGHNTTIMNISFSVLNEVLNSFSLNNYFENSNIFRESRGKRVLDDMAIFEGKGRNTTKICITFFMEHKVLNIFSLNNFFENSNIFRENRGKPVLDYMTIFEGKGDITTKGI